MPCLQVKQDGAVSSFKFNVKVFAVIAAVIAKAVEEKLQREQAFAK